MPRPRRWLVIVVAAVLATGAGGMYAYWHFLLRGPLAGDTRYDLGEVPLYRETEIVERTLRLRNRLSQPLTIVAVRPDCGCLAAPSDQRTIAPGESFDLPISFTVKAGKRTVIIHIAFDDGTTQALRVSARGVMQPRLNVAANAITLDKNATATVSILLSTFNTYDEPDSLQIETADPIISTEVSAWRLKFRPRDIADAPTQWEADLTIRATAASEPATGSSDVILRYQSALPVTIEVKSEATIGNDDSSPR